MRRLIFSALSTLGVISFILTSACCARAQEADAQPIPSASPSLIQANAEKTPPVALRFAPIAGGNATDLGQAPGTRTMAFHLVLKHSEAQQVALEKYAIEIANPRSPHYNKPLTVAEFTQRFGANAEDIAALKNWLQSQGFVVDSVHPGQMYLAFHGTAGAAEEAFGTEIHDYLMPDGRQLYANTRAIKIPAGFELAVLRVDGLDNFGVLQMPNYDGPVAIESHDTNILKSNVPTEEDRNPGWSWSPTRPDPTQANATANAHPDVTNKTTSVTLVAGAPVAIGSGLPVTLTATMNYTGAVTPTGSLLLYDSYGALAVQTSLSNCTAAAGSFTCIYSWANASGVVGGVRVFAQYSGDANFQSVTSTAIVYTNTKASGTAMPTSASVSISPGSVASGASTPQTVTWSATWATAPASGTLSVFGFDGPLGLMASTPITSCSLSSNTYTCTLTYTPPSNLPAGSYPVIATFSGDSTDEGFYDMASSLLNVTATGAGGSSLSVTGQNYVLYSNVGGVVDAYVFPTLSYSGATPPTGQIVFTGPSGTTTAAGFLAVAQLPSAGQTLSAGQMGFTPQSDGVSGYIAPQTYSCVTNTTAKTIGCTVEISSEVSVLPNTGDGQTDTLSVAYSGDTNYAQANTTYTQTLGAGQSATTITVSPNETYPTATVPTATIVVTNEGALAGVNTGSTYLPVGSVVLGVSGAAYFNAWKTITLNSTNCTATTANHAHYTCAVPMSIFPPALAGSYIVTAYYSGGVDSGSQNMGGSQSSPTATYVYSLQTPTVAMVSPTMAAKVTQTYGSLASFAVTGTLTWTGAGAAPTASDMSFTSTAAGTFSTTTCGATSPATCTATFTPTATDAAGTYNFSAMYTGDNHYGPSTTSTITGDYLINAAAQTLALTPSPLTAPQGSTAGVTLTATSTSTAGTPTGTVTFGGSYAGYGSLSATTCALSSGTCSVTFTPNGTTAMGTYSGVFTASVAANGNYLVSNTAMDSLQITAPPNVITFTSVGHNFGQIAVGSSTSGSSNYGVKLTNTATSAFAFGGIALNGSSEFSVQTNCPATIAAGGSCELLFTFAPTATGTVSATWSVSSSSTGFSYSPSNGGTLSGSGVANGGVSLTSAGHNFGTVTVGQTSSAYGTELSNSSSSTETISLGPVPAGAPFTMLTNCGTTLVPGQSCEIEFTFSPTSTSPVSVVVPLSGTPTAISSGGVVLANGGLALSGN